MSVSYDPTTDPRYVPPFAEPVREAETVLDVIDKLEVILDRYQKLDSMMQTEAWAYFMEFVITDGQELDAELRKELDQGRWKFLRGQKVWSDWVRELPAEVRRRADVALARYRELVGEQEA